MFKSVSRQVFVQPSPSDPVSPMCDCIVVGVPSGVMNNLLTVAYGNAIINVVNESLVGRTIATMTRL